MRQKYGLCDAKLLYEKKSYKKSKFTFYFSFAKESIHSFASFGLHPKYLLHFNRKHILPLISWKIQQNTAVNLQIAQCSSPSNVMEKRKIRFLDELCFCHVFLSKAVKQCVVRWSRTYNALKIIVGTMEKKWKISECVFL